jgi:thioredoxin-like negative regulator of GroEL
MANRFNVKIPVTSDPKKEEVAVVHVQELGEQDFDQEVTGAPLPVVLDFYARDSKPCEALAPRYAAVAGKFAGKVRFLKVLHAAHPALAARLGVAAAPTLVFFKAGQELGERLSGQDIQRTALKARVEALLA